MFPSSVLPDAKVLRYESSERIGRCFHLLLSSEQTAPACPLCQTPSTRVHSHYRRRVADLPTSGCQVSLELKVRKFFCDAKGCSRKVFCERLVKVVKAYGRRTVRLFEVQQQLGLLASAEVSHRLAAKLAMCASPDTFLRAAKQYQDNHDTANVQMIGIDDWAKKKGHSYGTIIVDHQCGTPVALLPDRESGTVTAWLRAHPGITLITRDRASYYAEACEAGAPQAEQVADLWHLLKNLFDAVASHMNRKIPHIKKALKSVDDEATTSTPPANPMRLSKPSSRQLERSAHAYQQRQQRFEEVGRLAELGWSQLSIGRELNICRHTVRKYLALDEAPLPSRRTRRSASVLEAYLPYLDKRWAEGCSNATQLFHELRAQGYAGGLTTVRSYLQLWREGDEDKLTRAVSQLPSARKLAWWCLADEDQLKDEEQRLLAEVLSAVPQLKRFVDLAQQGWNLFGKRKLSALAGWLSAVRKAGFKELSSFVAGILRDERAVKNAFRYAYTNGRTEGHVNRLKMIKRTMFGRAGFELLRAKVLYRG